MPRTMRGVPGDSQGGPGGRTQRYYSPEFLSCFLLEKNRRIKVGNLSEFRIGSFE